MNNKQKGIFITGAASGIGRATALHFAEKGWFTGIFDLNEEGLESLRSEIGKDQCCSARLDVRDGKSIQKAVTAFAEARGGQMDILLNNAGMLRMGLFDQICLQDQLNTVDVNLKGIISCIHASLDLLKNTSGSRIINLSSGSAMYGMPKHAVYSATKYAVRGLTEALNIELEKYGIFVCDIMPPYVNTPMLTEAEVQASSIEKLGIHLTPDKVAAVIWKAAHKKKLHWRIGGGLKFMEFMLWAFPFSRHSIVKYSVNLEK